MTKVITLLSDEKLAVGLKHHVEVGKFKYADGVLLLGENISKEQAVEIMVEERKSQITNIINQAFSDSIKARSDSYKPVGDAELNKVYTLSDNRTCVIEEMNENRIVTTDYINGIRSHSVIWKTTDDQKQCLDLYEPLTLKHDLDIEESGGSLDNVSPLKYPVIVSIEKSNNDTIPLERLRKFNFYHHASTLTKETVPSESFSDMDIIQVLENQNHNTLIEIDIDILNRLSEMNDEFELLMRLLRHKHCSIIVTHTKKDQNLPSFIERQYMVEVKSMSDKKMFVIEEKEIPVN